MNYDVIAVTVTYNRSETLNKTIDALLNQKKQLDKIIIVDNNSNDYHKERILEINSKSDKIDVVWSPKNLGGAGGFNMGMEYALENYNPSWYWIMDDDAYPTTDCLYNLFNNKPNDEEIGFLAPAIFGITKKEYQLYHHKKISRFKNKDEILLRTISGESNKVNKEIEANAFVGPLISRKAVEKVGLPDKDLFIYGDDTEYTYRISSCMNAYLITNAVINHEDPPMIDNSNASSPKHWWKDYYMVRNKYLFVNKYAKCKYEKFVGYTLLIKGNFISICAALTKKSYKGYRKLRINVILNAIIDGLKGKKGKTLDPLEYINKISI